MKRQKEMMPGFGLIILGEMLLVLSMILFEDTNYWFLYGSIVCTLLGIIYLVLAIRRKNKNDKDAEDKD